MKVDLPPELKWFAADTGDAVHGFGGVIDDEHEEERVRRVYRPGHGNVVKLRIGTYKLVEQEVIEA